MKLLRIFIDTITFLKLAMPFLGTYSKYIKTYVP